MSELIQGLSDPLIRIGAVILVIGFFILDYNHSAERLRQGLLALLRQAEQGIASGSGGAVNRDELIRRVADKAMAVVVPLLPFYLRPFFHEQAVRRMTAFLLEKAHDYLDDGRLNDSFVWDESRDPADKG